jgi:hypothetical protein
LETIELPGVTETDIIGVLKFLPDVWNERKGYFGSRMISFLNNDIRSDENLVLSRLYLHDYTTMTIIFAEYRKDTKIAILRVHCYRTGEFGFKEAKDYEEKIRELIFEKGLRNLRHVPYEDPVEYYFECPKCKAVYMLNNLRKLKDGRIECHACKGLFHPADSTSTK